MSKKRGSVLIQTDFESDPMAAGWGGLGTAPQPFDGEWKEGGAHSGRHCLLATQGGWESPPVPVEPFALYQVAFASQSDHRAYWMIRSFDAVGREILADHYTSIDESKDWAAREFYYVARAKAAWARLSFRPIQSPLLIDDVTLRKATREEALQWLDALIAEIPAVHYAPDPSRWRYIPKTIERLRNGKEVRFLFLGDSIANDISNSLFHALVERHYPGSRILLYRSVRGGGGCQYYEHENRVQSLVVEDRPDLLIVGGASHGNLVAPYRNVIRQVRSRMEVEVLVITDAFVELGSNSEYMRLGYIPAEAKAAAVKVSEGFRAELRAMAEEEHAAFLDIRDIWDRSIRESPKPLSWYQRDWVHANTRGHAVVARILDQFFAPDLGR